MMDSQQASGSLRRLRLQIFCLSIERYLRVGTRFLVTLERDEISKSRDFLALHYLPRPGADMLDPR